MSAEPKVVDPYADARMTVIEHLYELRRRVLWAALGVAICVGISWGFVEEIFELLMMPLRAAAPNAELAEMHHKDLAEPFFVLLKTAIFAGVFASVPWLLVQLWAFVAPGLYVHEKRVAIPFVLLATLFFVGGSSFCFFVVMPLGYEFLLLFSMEVSQPELMMNEYLALTTKLLLGFGLIFELPVFSMFLSWMGILTHHHLIKFWRHSVVAAFIIAAILTPPDVVTQTLMAVPLIVLYFVSIGVAWFFTTRREARLAEELGTTDE